MDIKIGDRVSVRWDETGRMFNATVQSVHTNVPWTFDVLYDEQVQGKPCVEKRVAIDRMKRFGSPSPSHRNRAPVNDEDLVVIDDPVQDDDEFMQAFTALDEDDTGVQMYWGDQPPGSAPGSASKRKNTSSSSAQNVLQYLAQLRDDGDVDLQQVELTSAQILQLHDLLTPAEISHLVDSDSGRSVLELAARCLSDALQSAHVDTAFDSKFQASGVDSVSGWLGAAGKGSKQFGHVRAALAAGATLMRLLAQCAQELDATVVSEEQVERAVGLCLGFLVNNALMPGMSAARQTGAGGGSGGGSGGGKQRKGKGAAKGEDDEDEEEERGGLEAMVTVGKSKFKVKQTTRRLLAEVGKAMWPLLTATLQALEGLMLARRQGDRLCVVVYEVRGCYCSPHTTVCFVFPHYCLLCVLSPGVICVPCLSTRCDFPSRTLTWFTIFTSQSFIFLPSPPPLHLHPSTPPPPPHPSTHPPPPHPTPTTPPPQLAFTVLRVDPGSNPQAELLDPTATSAASSSTSGAGGALLGPLHRAALSLLRTVFKRYPTHRPAMVQEVLPVLCQAYGARTVSRTYPLHHSAHVGQARVTTAFAAVLYMMQGAVSCASGLAVLSNLSPAPATATATATTTAKSNASTNASASASASAKGAVEGSGKKRKSPAAPAAAPATGKKAKTDKNNNSRCAGVRP